jgi:hypothetical protein
VASIILGSGCNSRAGLQSGTTVTVFELFSGSVPLGRSLGLCDHRNAHCAYKVTRVRVSERFLSGCHGVDSGCVGGLVGLASTLPRPLNSPSRSRGQGGWAKRCTEPRFRARW